jgi:uncharacterized protein DUF4331
MKRAIRILGILLTSTVTPLSSLAADHGDSPSAAASNEPTADITDLYAWMSNDDKLNLVMAVNPDAGPNAHFSEAVTYVFYISSSAGYGQPQQNDRVICKFVDQTNIECWLGNEYVVGDPSARQGIVSDNGGMRVFAGLRDDPFFLEYTGFANAVSYAVSEVVAGNVVSDPANEGCPTLSTAQGVSLRNRLTHGANNAPPSNTFAKQNVLALVVQVDKSLVNRGGPVLGVSASTHASN